MTHTATRSFKVQLLPLTFEGLSEGSKIGRMSIDKTISGDLVATTQG